MNIHDLLKHILFLKKNKSNLKEILQEYGLNQKFSSGTDTFVFTAEKFFSQVMLTIKNKSLTHCVLYTKFEFSVDDLRNQLNFLETKYVPYDDIYISKFQIRNLNSILWIEIPSENLKTSGDKLNSVHINI
ncbi:hypothetical protein [Mesonia maritima]|uniref:Uncharacterized protein n=1 Tax=Mesonia maritima TaxID=1793873 RepID=A0ABU1K9M9_9FLAO|nr:hypothetical protein [Mesonia maritima]MDR6302311.1 hypothetical protein [Mesonia maritima]